MNSYWRSDRGQSVLSAIRFIAGSVVAPIALVRLMFALFMPTDPFPWTLVVPLLLGVANLRLKRQPMPWLGVAAYTVVMLAILVNATFLIACISYDSCP